MIVIFISNSDTAWNEIPYSPTEDIVLFEHDNFKCPTNYISKKMNNPESSDDILKFKSSYLYDQIKRNCNDDEMSNFGPHSIRVTTKKYISCYS